MVMNFVPIMTHISWDQACWWPGSLWQLCSRVAIMGQHSTPQMPLRGCQKSVCTLKQLLHKLYPEILFILVNMAVGSAVVLNTFCILGQYWRNCDQSMGHSPPWLTAHSHLLVSLSSLSFPSNKLSRPYSAARWRPDTPFGETETAVNKIKIRQQIYEKAIFFYKIWSDLKK